MLSISFQGVEAALISYPEFKEERAENCGNRCGRFNQESKRFFLTVASQLRADYCTVEDCQDVNRSTKGDALQGMFK